ncbi:MAG: hypothetical protein WBX81_09415 [Nitrososphaeraceae archaeon]
MSYKLYSIRATPDLVLWTPRERDVGTLSIVVEVRSQGYPPSSAMSSFDIVDNS